MHPVNTIPKPVLKQIIIAAAFLVVPLVFAQNPAPAPKEVSVIHAAGPFDVKVTPQDDKSDDPLIGRMALDKQYHGDLEGTGKGQMLTAATSVKGSGAYVAIEKFTGTLKGHSGTFVLQHLGTMTQNVPQLSVSIVPDSGTGELKGIAGKMTINIAPGGKHSYDLEYTMP
jgi:uncharacterized protein DUF3224